MDLFSFFRRGHINRKAPKPVANRSPDRAVSPTPSYRIGERIAGRYLVLQSFEGGLGTVNVVQDEQHRKDRGQQVFVLKSCKSKLSDRQKLNFFEEARIWISLGAHPNIVAAFWVEELAGQVFVAAELVEPDDKGRTTLEVYLQRPLALQQILAFASHFCFGMEHALSRGFVAHRDIKPQNLLVGQDGVLKITDFGISVFDQSSADEISKLMRPLTNLSVSGTPPYMPPEQWAGGACDIRSDIYSFGVVLHQMCYARMPWPMFSVREAYDCHLHRDLELPGHALDGVIRRCMEKAVEKRYQNVSALLADLSIVSSRARLALPTPPVISDADYLLQRDLRAKSSLGTAGDISSALRAAQELVRRWPDDSSGWTQLGRLQLELGNLTAAELATRQSLSLDATRAAPHNNLGAILNRMNRYEEALLALRAALSIEPENTGAMLNASGSLRNLARDREAEQYLIAASKIAPDKYTIWANLGFLYADNKHQDRALECLQKALTLAPSNASAMIREQIDKLSKTSRR